MNSRRMFGVVKWFDNRKGYGFITSLTGENYFVHYTAISTFDRFKTLHKGDDVGFVPIKTDRGLRAKTVTLLNRKV